MPNSENMEVDCKRIEELEKVFSANHYNGSGNTAFRIEEGSVPIMLSAPHAVNHFRDGKLKAADCYTGGIARYLRELTGCPIIYSASFTETDPNYDSPEAGGYKESLKAYLKTHPVYLLMDLHGAAREREFAVEMGTAPRKRKEDASLLQYPFVDDVIKSVLEKKFLSLNTEKKNISKNVFFAAKNQNTIANYISTHTNTACIQLEINREYRETEHSLAMQSLVEGLRDCISYFSTLDWDKLRRTFE